MNGLLSGVHSTYAPLACSSRQSNACIMQGSTTVACVARALDPSHEQLEVRSCVCCRPPPNCVHHDLDLRRQHVHLWLVQNLLPCALAVTSTRSHRALGYTSTSATAW